MRSNSRKKHLFILLFAISPLLFHATAPDSRAQVIINECMASNTGTIADPQGDYADWIEIYNPMATPVDIGGMYLTDDLGDPTKHRLPTDSSADTTIPANGYLILWADNDLLDGPTHLGFKLSGNGEAIGLYAASNAAPIDTIVFGPQYADISHGRYPNGGGAWRFFTTPTPGAQNNAGYAGFVADTKFSHHRDFYDAPFQVTITCSTEGAQIRYTLNGSEPTASSALYGTPIPINTTAILRAAAFKTNWKPSNADTQTYIFLDDVLQQPAAPSGFPSRWITTNNSDNIVADYQMDPDVIGPNSAAIKTALKTLPTMSIVTNVDHLFNQQTGIYSNPEQSGLNWERSCSLEWIDPAGGDEFQVNCGLRIQGGYFRQPNVNKKHSFRILFKSDYGPTKLKFALFGDNDPAMNEFDTITLRANANDGYSWAGHSNVQFIRDEFGRKSQLAVGQVASHGTFVHLYVNGLYWGLHNPVERPAASFAASYYGTDKANWDALNSDEAVDGSTAAWSKLNSLCAAGLADNAAYQLIQGNDPDGTPNPDYPDYIDIENYIDYLIVNHWAGNNDWPHKNWYAARDRVNSTGFKFFMWDSEWSLLMNSDLNMNKTTDHRSVAQPYGYLKANEEFKLLYADRLHKHLFNDGALTAAAAIARYQSLADEVEPHVLAEIARWGDMQSATPYTKAQWDSMRNQILNSYLPNRRDVVLGQYNNIGLYPNTDAPEFHINGAAQHGGAITTGDTLTLDPTDGQVYYTLDGADPRRPGFDDGPSDSTTLVPENAPKAALVPTEDIGPDWKSSLTFDDSAWKHGDPANDVTGVGYDTQTNYLPYFDIDVKAEMYNTQTTCYIRIPFTVNAADLDIFNVLSLRVRYDDGFIAYLNGQQIEASNEPPTPTWQSNSISQNSDTNAVNLESFDVTGHLDALVAGQNLLAIHGLNFNTGSSDFLISADLTARQVSPPSSSILTSSAILYSGALELQDYTHIKARALNGATWSALSEATFAPPTLGDNLRLTEIMYDPPLNPGDVLEAKEYEFIEFQNIGYFPIDLRGARFTDGIEFQFGSAQYGSTSSSCQLASGAYLVIVANRAAFESRYGSGIQIAGQFETSLSNGGEGLLLLDALGATLHDFAYDNTGAWPGRANGNGSSLELLEPNKTAPSEYGQEAKWRSSAEYAGSPGRAGAKTYTGVIINEILSHTDPPQSDSIEIHNLTDASIDIGGWYISDSNQNYFKYAIPAGSTIGSGDYENFDESDFNPTPLTPAAHHFAFNGARGDEACLLAHDGNGIYRFVDRVEFPDAANGESFGRWPDLTGDLYPMIAATFGSANSGPRVGPIVISELHYRPTTPTLPLLSEDLEFIEIHNPDDITIDLQDWRIRKGVDFDFVDGPIATLPPFGVLVVVSFDPDLLADATKLAAFRAAYSIDETVAITGPYQGKLDNGGEKIQLQRPDAPPIDDPTYTPHLIEDEIDYIDLAPWPTSPDGQGDALARLGPQLFGNDASSWIAASPTPGQAIFNLEGMPSVLTHPVSQTTQPGASVTFSVAAEGDEPLSYQWKLNGVAISGATASTYTISAIRAGHAGFYTCEVKNNIGVDTSHAARLTVTLQPPVLIIK